MFGLSKQVLKSLSWFRDWWVKDQAHVIKYDKHDTIRQERIYIVCDIIAAGGASLPWLRRWQNGAAKLEQVVAGRRLCCGRGAVLSSVEKRLAAWYVWRRWLRLSWLQSVWLKNLKSYRRFKSSWRWCPSRACFSDVHSMWLLTSPPCVCELHRWGSLARIGRQKLRKWPSWPTRIYVKILPLIQGRQ